MELPNLGQQCTKSDCKQLDFLPFECANCSLIFCKQHFGPESHDCEKRPNNTVTVKKRNEDVYMCSVDGCSKTELAPIRCSRCEVQVCLTHRAEQDHACSKYAPPKDRMVKTREVVDCITKKNAAAAEAAPPQAKLHRNPKAQRMAAKVQLMRLKQKSNGDQSLPPEERIYLRVILPKGGKTPSAGAFVSRRWSMGRVIDAMASSSGVQNRNNVAGTKKLRLFRLQDGHNLSLELEKQLSQLVEGEQLFNGDSVVLEYVDEDLVARDLDPKEYAAT